jgi:cytochrome oxidase Cu insertion factor (SCO1/SenC/PrrC family)
VGERNNKRGRFQLWLIILMVTGVFVAAFLVLPNSEEEKARLLNILGTSNKGTLLIPMAPIADLSSTQDGKHWRWDELKPKWRLVLPIVNGCDQTCRDMLYMSRQVHIRLDKKTHRVERVLLNLGAPLDEETLVFLAREHIYLKLVSANKEAFADLLAHSNAAWNEDTAKLFVLDPRGDLMMFYTPEHDGGDILADLRHLLKYSPEP